MYRTIVHLELSKTKQGTDKVRYDPLDGVGRDVELFKRQTLFEFKGEFSERVVGNVEDDKGGSEDSEEGRELVDELG